MVDYYKNLVANKGRSEALRQAQLKMLNDQSRAHPFYWASFIPSGNWTKLGTRNEENDEEMRRNFSSQGDGI